MLLGILLPALSGARSAARLAEDQKRGQSIQNGWTTWAAQNDSEMPMPGNVDRQQIMQGGEMKNIMDRGTPNYAYNTTANVHSLCIMDRIYEPRTVVLASDVNPSVDVCDYNYNNYYPYGDIGDNNASDPGLDGYLEAQDLDLHWDPLFNGDLEDECHFSWASTALFGTRVAPRKGYWSMSGRPDVVILCTRGPRMGDQVAESMTYAQYAPSERYRGVMVFNDGSTSVEDSMYPTRTMYSNKYGQCPDNVYMWDCPPDAPSCTPYKDDSLNLIVTEIGNSLPWDQDAPPSFEASWDDEE
ncbi:MAG: hypothetical protein MK116_13320 [Phycisphaerales bacterium]|nr:hypothetical protein [Phycisphaerales bacterium]